MNTPDQATSRKKIITILLILVGLLVLSGSLYWYGVNDPNEVLFDPVRDHSVTYLTIRAKSSDDPNELYGGERGAPQWGICNFEFETFKPLKKLSENAPFYIPSDKTSLVSVLELDDAEVQRRLDAVMQAPDTDIVIYIHGYNIGFEKACRRAATFKLAMDSHHHLILFSWPADGKVLNYTRDEVDVEWSVPHIHEFLSGLKSRYPDETIHLVAHSMGGRGLVKALAYLRGNNDETPLYDHLILLAPDIDTGVFAQLFPMVKKMVKHATLYASDKDSALKVSRRVHGYPRLGEAGEYLTVLPGLETIDVSTAGMRSASGHIYHQRNPVVLADINQILDKGLYAENRSGLVKQTKQGLVFWQLHNASGPQMTNTKEVTSD